MHPEGQGFESELALVSPQTGKSALSSQPAGAAAGKRARAETGIARTGISLLSLAIEAAFPGLPAPAPAGTASGAASLAGRDVLVVGAGTMSALAVAAARRDGAASLVLANRTRRRAERLAARSGVAATRVTGLADLPAAVAAADVVICCTGTAGHVITADMAPARRRDALVFLDLAMPARCGARGGRPARGGGELACPARGGHRRRQPKSIEGPPKVVGLGNTIRGVLRAVRQRRSTRG